MHDCLFCKMANKEIATKIIYENDDFFVIHDIDPQAPLHLLAIAKKHCPDLKECSGQVDLNSLPQLLRALQDNGTLPEHFRIVINTGSTAGQTVFHLHVHILANRTMQWPPG